MRIVRLPVFTLLPLFLLVALPLWAQRAPQAPLPIRLTEAERDIMPLYADFYEYLMPEAFRSAITTPPTFPVRTMAEWEEIQTLVITWAGYNSTLREIVRHARLECEVLIVCSDSNTVKSYLTQGSVPLAGVRYLIAPYNTIWMRDYGANTVYRDAVDSLMLVDWVYNRPRPKDDTIPNRLATTFNLPLYATAANPYRLVHTGGNFMSDGFGTAFSSELVLEENTSKTEAQIDDIMSQFMGISRYVKMPVLPYDGIHHIDMHMKLLDERTLLMGQYPPGVSDGPQIEANLAYVLSNFPSRFATPYKIVRIPMPPDGSNKYPSNFGDYRTYTNAVFVNRTVLVPTYEQRYDTTALRIWRQALPGYNVVGINCDNIIQAGGAIHCITHSIGVNDPLLISHGPIDTVLMDEMPAYPVLAEIRHRSGIASATLFYSTDTAQGYLSMPMQLADANAHLWQASVPLAQGGDLFYYILATANNGKTMLRPMSAPEGYWKTTVIQLTAAERRDRMTRRTLGAAFPNPASALTCIPVFSGAPQKASLRLYDLMGKEVQTVFEGLLPEGESKHFFHAGALPAGVYLAVLQTLAGRETQKIMVVKR